MCKLRTIFLNIDKLKNNLDSLNSIFHLKQSAFRGESVYSSIIFSPSINLKNKNKISITTKIQHLITIKNLTTKCESFLPCEEHFRPNKLELQTILQRDYSTS